MNRALGPYEFQPGNYVVYRFYDADDRLLYVGMTWNLPNRIAQHRRTEWFKKERVRTEVVRVGPEREARRLEREAIRTESPKYNVSQNPEHRGRHGSGRLSKKKAPAGQGEG